MGLFRIRAATDADASALGEVMVESWLSAHRGQIPEPAWQKRVDEWTPAVSAAAWRRFLDETAQDASSGDVLLVCEDDGGMLSGLVLGTRADDAAATHAEIRALYVRPDLRGQGIGRALLLAAADGLVAQGFASLDISVLTANLPARAFYEAMGGEEHGHGTFDEDGHLLPTTTYRWHDLTGLRR